MQKPGQDVCGCCGSESLRELQLLAQGLERRQSQQGEPPEARGDAIPASSSYGLTACTPVNPQPGSIAKGGAASLE